MDEDEDEDEDHEVVPPWAFTEGGWEALQARRAGLFKIFQSHAVLPPAPVMGDEGGGEGGGGDGGGGEAGEAGASGGGYGTGGAIGTGLEALYLTQEGALVMAKAMASSGAALLDEVLSAERALEFFMRVQGQPLPVAEAAEGAEGEGPLMALNFEDCLTWLWFCARERFGLGTDGFEGRVKDWIDTLPQLATAPAPPPEVAEPVAKSPGKGKKK